jgi:hypothetical protein
MNWKTREHFDKETREKLQESIPDVPLLDEVIRAYEYDVASVERREAELQGVYAHIPSLLAQTSEISGISQEHLLTITRRIATTSRDMEWYQVLGMVNSFFRIKENLLKEENNNG